jgi:hypothetical protein
LAWPKSLADQAAAVQGALAAFGAPVDEEAVAERFARLGKNGAERVGELLETLASLGKARELEDGRWLAM